MVVVVIVVMVVVMVGCRVWLRDELYRGDRCYLGCNVHLDKSVGEGNNIVLDSGSHNVSQALDVSIEQ